MLQNDEKLPSVNFRAVEMARCWENITLRLAIYADVSRATCRDCIFKSSLCNGWMFSLKQFRLCTLLKGTTAGSTWTNESTTALSQAQFPKHCPTLLPEFPASPWTDGDTALTEMTLARTLISAD